VGPFLLSQVSGAPVLPAFVIRRGWLRYDALIGKPIPPVPPSVIRGADDPKVHEAIGRAVKFLETTLAIYYDQWMNFFDFWAVAPRD